MPGAPEDIKKVEGRIAAVSTKLERLLDLYLDGTLDKAVYNYKHKELEAELKLLSAELSKLSVMPAVVSVETLKQAILKYSESEPTDKAESLRLLLTTFVDHIELSNEHIIIYFKFELPGLPESSSFDFVRKSTSVSICVITTKSIKHILQK